MKNSLHSVAALVSLLLSLAGVAIATEGFPPAPPPGGGMGKTVVARVNGVEITMDALVTMMGSLRARMGNEAELPQTMEETRKEALDQLILQELAYQKAKSGGLIPDPKEIDEALMAMKQKVGGEEKWKEALEKGPITEDEMRSRIERNLALRRVLQREVRDKVSVSEEELREEYEKEKGRYARPEKVVVVDVVFFLEPDDPDSRGGAEETLKRIHDDPEKDPWNLVSDGTFAVRDMEVREDREIGVYVEAKKLKVGELSGVFASEGNLHVIKLKEYSPHRQFPFEEVKSQMKAEAMERAQKKRLEKWGAELRKGAKIEIVEAGGGRK